MTKSELIQYLTEDTIASDDIDVIFEDMDGKQYVINVYESFGKTITLRPNNISLHNGIPITI